MGVWTFSKVGELGQDCIHHLRDGECYVDCVTAIDNYNHHRFMRFETHRVWNIDPQYEPFKTMGNTLNYTPDRPPPDPKARIVINNCVIGYIYAKAVTGTPTKEAIAWVEGA
jgi:hypothetical protein